MDQENTATKQQYLTFMLSDEEYALDIQAVQELRSWEQATPIPNAPKFVCGVMNLRGVIVPVIDLRIRFGLAPIAYNNLTVMIIVKARQDNKECMMGLVVDAVADVYDIEIQNTQPPPDMAGTISIDFINGLASIDHKMLIILNINKLVYQGILNQQV